MRVTKVKAEKEDLQLLRDMHQLATAFERISDHKLRVIITFMAAAIADALEDAKTK